MSASVLYHTFRVRGYQLLKTEFQGGMTIFHIGPQESLIRCSACNSENVIRRGWKERYIRNLPVGDRLTWLATRVPRVECRDCGVIRQIATGFSDPRRTYTRAFARYVLELSRHMTILDIAYHLGVSWDVIKDIQKQYLERHFSRPRLKDVGEIAIDEICIGRGYRYITIVLDLHTGAIVFVGEGKGADALVPFWRRLRRSGAKIKAAAMDMSKAYISAVGNNLPQAKIVFDRFHIVKLLNKKITALRRELYAQATCDLEKKVLKGTRWLLLKRPENLDDERGERKRLKEALEMNESLSIAYYLKEDLRELWEQDNKNAAKCFLKSWYTQAMASGIRQLQSFARTLLAHAWGIYNWYDYEISTGPLEGLNNKIKTMQRQHYGLRDHDFFILKLYALHETRYALVG